MHTSKENPLALALVWIISAFVLLSAVGYMIKSLSNHSSRIIESGNASPQILTTTSYANPDEAIEQHLKPIGKVVISAKKASSPTITPEATETAVAAPTPSTADSITIAGNETVAKVCSNCHSAAMAKIIGAPQMHTDAWVPRMEKGFDAVLKNAQNGLNAMPPRGGKPDLTDEQLAAAIRFMSSPAQ